MILFFQVPLKDLLGDIQLSGSGGSTTAHSCYLIEMARRVSLAGSVNKVSTQGLSRMAVSEKMDFLCKDSQLPEEDSKRQEVETK